MAIFSIQPVKVGQVGVQPNVYKMITDQSVSTAESAGFLQQGQGGNFYVNNDQIDAICLFGTSGAVNALFTVSVNQNTGVITLSGATLPGLGTAAFKNTSNNSVPTVSAVIGTPTMGAIATFGDANGSVSSSPGNVRAQIFSYAGGSAAFTITDSNISTNQVVMVQPVTEANAAYVLTSSANTGSISVLMNADPGVSTFNYIALNRQ